MRARKPVGRASHLLTGITTDSRPVPQPVTRDTPRDDAYYIAQTKAARPAILLYLNGNGPRPKDFWLWHDASQDRKALRRLHAKGLAPDDPRSLDALIEALHAGDPLSRKEKRDLAGYVRLMVDLMYPSLQDWTSQLSAQARALGAYKNRRQVATRKGQKKGLDSIAARVEDWHEAALDQAHLILDQTSDPKPRNLTRLTMTMCGHKTARWDPKAPWYWEPTADPRKIAENDPEPHRKGRGKLCVAADRLKRFLRTKHLSF